MEILISFREGMEYLGSVEALLSAIFEARDIMRELAAPRYEVMPVLRDLDRKSVV